MQDLRQTTGIAAGLKRSGPVEVGQGALAVSDDPDMVMTATLGSCVLVCLTDPIARMGGMTHIFQCVDPGPTGGAFVIVEVEKLVNALMQAGSPKSALEARIAGGARTLGRGRDVGGEIASVCLEFLKKERIPIVFSDLGGVRPRRVRYTPATNQLDIAYPGANVVETAPPVPSPAGSEPELF